MGPVAGAFRHWDLRGVMVANGRSKEPVRQEAKPYESPALSRFGTIEEWTLGALDGISISIVV